MAIFSWCLENRHKACKSEFEQFYIDTKGKVVETGVTIKCECKKRGCPCYVKPADRPKKTKTRRKK